MTAQPIPYNKCYIHVYPTGSVSPENPNTIWDAITNRRLNDMTEMIEVYSFMDLEAGSPTLSC